MLKNHGAYPPFYLNLFIGAVWLINGLFCKVFNLVPRHREIVAAITGQEHAATLTIAIGILETAMAVWIFSRYRFRLAAIIQAVVVGMMNIIEFFIAPDLLLFGRMNILFAAVLILLVLINGRILTSNFRNA